MSSNDKKIIKSFNAIKFSLHSVCFACLNTCYARAAFVRQIQKLHDKERLNKKQRLHWDKANMYNSTGKIGTQSELVTIRDNFFYLLLILKIVKKLNYKNVPFLQKFSKRMNVSACIFDSHKTQVYYCIAVTMIFFFFNILFFKLIIKLRDSSDGLTHSVITRRRDRS